MGSSYKEVKKIVAYAHLNQEMLPKMFMHRLYNLPYDPKHILMCTPYLM